MDLDSEGNSRPGRRPPIVRQQDTESVWSHNNMNQEQHQQEEEVEEVPPPLLAGGRSDTINSHTAYASLADIQPRQTERYSGVTLTDHSQHLNPADTPADDDFSQLVYQDDQEQPQQFLTQTVSGIKRNIEEEAEELENKNKKVIIAVNSANGEQCYTQDPFENMIIVDHQESVITKQDPVSYSPATLNLVPPHQIERSDQPIATCSNPSIDNWPGHFMFDVIFNTTHGKIKNKHWDYSSALKKLFIDINRPVEAEFKVGSRVPPDMFIRVLPVYSDATNCRIPVVRCPNHASPSEPTNNNFNYPQHLIRVDNTEARYETDDSSGRLSTVFPVHSPHAGSDRVRELIRFMCLGSDVGGINRRPLRVIFTLETGPGTVIGRKVVDVRICSCPKRDKQQEEERNRVLEEKAKGIGQRIADTTLVMPPPGKKVLMKKSSMDYIMLPVFTEDFKHLNEVAESLIIAREVQKDPSNATNIIKKIKEERRLLMVRHNPDKVKTTKNKV